jgi:hypothetical protein
MVDLKRRGFLARMLAAPAAVPAAVEIVKAMPVALPEAPAVLPAVAPPSFNVARTLGRVTEICVSGCFAQADTSVHGMTVSAHISPVQSRFGSEPWEPVEDSGGSESWEDDDDDDA